MSKKRQFRGTANPPKHYDRRVLRYGYSAMISMGRIIPKDWTHARVRVLEQSKKKIIVELERLKVVTNNAPNKKIGEKREQNTQRTRPAGRNKHSSRKS